MLKLLGRKTSGNTQKVICYIVNHWYRLPVVRREFANVKAWFDRLCERPAFRRHVYEVG